MGIYRIQHCFQGSSVDADQRYCNTIHVLREVEATPINWLTDTVGGGSPIGARTEGYVRGFYQDVFELYGSTAVQHAGEFIKIFRMADAPPRSPVYTSTNPSVPITEGAGPDGLGYSPNLPDEVAVCLSFEAILGSGPRARRRGRIYLGPLNAYCLNNTGTTGPRVDAGMGEVVTTAWNALSLYLEGLDLKLGIYSPTDDVFSDWQTCWVDNAFDTQRRRGQDPTARTTFERA